MNFIFDIINKPLSIVLTFLCDIFNGNFAVSVLLFTFIANIVMLPLSIKSQKSTVQQTRIKPKLDELRKRYGDDKQKMAEAQQKLYQEEGVSMSGGCLPLIVRLVIMISIYNLILSPITYMTGVQKDKVNNVKTTISNAMTDLEKHDKEKYEKISKELSISKKDSNNELVVVRIVRNNPEIVKEILSDKEYAKIKDDFDTIVKKDNESKINYTLFGIDLTDKPSFSFDFSNFELIWLIPIGAFLSQILTSVISMAIQKKNNPDAPTMAGMMLTMPLITLFIGFSLPGGVGFYWICSSLIGGLIQSAIQILYGPQRMLANERAKELKKQLEFEAKQIEKIGNGTAE
ncbi:MAG: YidC/Oxa1 family membrane protein insertase [Clostridia bacterium]|nr:YidC/Oxa1 family membrane protein insertase [Clostridia bacterium]